MVDLTKYGVEPKTAHQKLAVKALGKQVRRIEDVPSVLGQALAACGQFPLVSNKALFKVLKARCAEYEREFGLSLGKFSTAPYFTVSALSTLDNIKPIIRKCIDDFGIACNGVSVICIGLFDGSGMHTIDGVESCDLPSETLAKYRPAEWWLEHRGIVLDGHKSDDRPEDVAFHDDFIEELMV